MATFLDVLSDVPVVLVVQRRGRFSVEESTSSVRRGLFLELLILDELTNGSPIELFLERFFDHL